MPSRAAPAFALLLSLASLAACAGRRPPPDPAQPPSPATSVEAPPLPIAPDAVAESLLVDVRSADSTIQVDARYATANNFTGAPASGV